VVVGGSLGCWVGFAILGNSTLDLVNSGHAGLNAMIDAAASGGPAVDAPQVVVELLKAQPFSMGVSVVFFVLTFIFVATSLDSAAFTLAAAASNDLPVDGQPARWHRLAWAFILAGTAMSLMFAGGLEVLQAASVVVGLPVLFIMGIMVLSMMRQMKEDA
jgi:BCCT family betaine/carnitine transporter